jgi:hypothetical protein
LPTKKSRVVNLAAHLAPWDWLEKKKRRLELFRANWKICQRLDRTTLGAALDAGERSGPRWTGDAWLARRRRYSTARRDRVIA